MFSSPASPDKWVGGEAQGAEPSAQSEPIGPWGSRRPLNELTGTMGRWATRAARKGLAHKQGAPTTAPERNRPIPAPIPGQAETSRQVRAGALPVKPGSGEKLPWRATRSVPSSHTGVTAAQ